MLKKKIVHIIPSLELGGAEIMLEELSYEQSNYNNVMIICLYDRSSPIKCRMKSKHIDVLSLHKKRGLDFKLLGDLRKTLIKANPDVIHTHLNALIHLLLVKHSFKKIPVVHTIHTTADKEFSLLKRVFISYYYRNKRVNPVAISSQIQTSFLNVYKKTKIVPPVIWNGINVNNISYKNDYMINHPVKLVHVGNFKPAKNHKALIIKFDELIKTSPMFELHLYGIGPLQTEIIQLVNKLSLNSYVKFCGQSLDVQSILKTYDIFILTSLWEGMPISIIEAMSAGLPIISTNVGGIPDMIKSNENGILINPSLNRFVEVIILLATNHELREIIGKSARIKSLEFTSSKMSMLYLQFYTDISKIE